MFSYSVMSSSDNFFKNSGRCEGKSCSEESRKECCNRPGPSVSFLQQVMASCSGAIVTSLLMTPMDVVKIRLQQQVHPFPDGQCFYYHNGLMDHLCTPCKNKQPCEWYERPGKFSGTLDAFVKITRNEGLKSLWSGLSPTLIMAVPATVFYFSVYDNLLISFRKKICCRRTFFPEKWCPPEWSAAMVAGAAARTLAVTIVSPLEIIRTKMQSEQMRYKDIGKALRISIATHGLSSFYFGLVSTLLRDIPFSAIYWGCYDYLKQNVLQLRGCKETTFTMSFLCGASSGMFAAMVTTPFDVVKTHRQITIGNRNSVKRVSTIEVMKDIVRSRGGPSALFAGIIPRVAKVAPACAIMIGSYEYFKLYFERRNSLRD